MWGLLQGLYSGGKPKVSYMFQKPKMPDVLVRKVKIKSQCKDIEISHLLAVGVCFMLLWFW